LTPFFGVLFGWLLVGDRFSLIELGGGVLVVGGVAMLSTDPR